MDNDGVKWKKPGRSGAWLDAIGWALFFIWIGVILLVRTLPDGLGSLGIGVIVLAVALARMLLHRSVSIFWIIIGAVFTLAGVAELAGINVPLLPASLILCGVLLLFHQWAKRK